ncbi:MAG TPA: glycosyltransferase family 1 protein [Vicinamibacterales bacterium]
MKVGIMWRHFGERGGISVYTDAVLRHLVAQDGVTEYVAFVRPGATPPIQAPNLRYVPVAARSKLVWDQFALPAAAEREGIDVVFNPKLAVPLRGRFRTAFALHGMEQVVEARNFPLSNRLYVRATLPRFCRHADAIFCPTTIVKREIAERMGAAPDRIHVTPYGLQPQFLRPITDADLSRVRQRYNLPDRYLLFVGGLTPLKNLPTMLRAMARLRDRIAHQLVLTGFSRWTMESGLGAIRELGLESRVHNAGWIEDDDQPALYRLASVLLLPSLYEGFGFPVIEAMASGCPVVTSTGGSLPEVAGDAALIVDALDADQLADAAQRLVEDQSLREQLVARGLERAAQFRWEPVAARLREVFASLAA